MNIFPDKKFKVPIYTLNTNSDGIDEETLVSTTEYDCRITELSTKDINLLNGVGDETINTFKLYTNDDVDLSMGDKIIFENKEYKVLRQYKPTLLTSGVAYTKIYFREDK